MVRKIFTFRRALTNAKATSCLADKNMTNREKVRNCVMQQKMVALFTTPFGRKNLEAGTGALLLLFMVEHFVANLMLLINDPEPYRWYTETMGRAILVRGMEVGLFLLFAIHIGIGL